MADPKETAEETFKKIAADQAAKERKSGQFRGELHPLVVAEVTDGAIERGEFDYWSRDTVQKALDNIT